MKSKTLSYYSLKVVGWDISAFIILLPFLAFFSIAFGTYGLGQGLLLSIAIIWSIYALSSSSIGFKLDRTNLLFILILLLSLVTTIFIRPNNTAVIFGIKNNIFPLVILFVSQLPFSKNSIQRKYLPWMIVVPGFIVASLAILQTTIIPISLLEAIGYNSATIDPRQIVDGSLNIYRAFSTLGGPNQLGAYLLIPLSFAIIYGINKRNWWFIGSIPFILAGIALSFSRSAWIATIATIFFAIFMILNKRRKKIYVLIATAVFVVLGSMVFFFASTNMRFQNVILHGRVFENKLMGSDQQRISALSEAVDLVLEQPFGHGLGSAGPASFQTSSPVITENWYLQIAYEVGIFGVLLYIIAFLSLLMDFYKNKIDPMACALFAATIGILIANLFLHTWADSTLSMLAFVLYGLYKGKSL